MRYVLDSSVALKWVLAEQDSPKANVLRQDARQQVHELIAPNILPVEVAHALTRAERRGIIPVGRSAILLADVLLTHLQLFPYLPLLPRAVALSSNHRLGVYDCLYVALAERA